MLGEVPRGWRQVRVGDLGGTYNGLSGKSKDDFGLGSPFVTYRQVFSGRPIDLAECDRVQVGPTENQASVRKGDVLFTISSETVEEVAFSTVVHADIPGLYLNSFCFGFRPHDGAPLDAHFAQYFFRGPDFRTAAIRLGQGSTRYNISKTRLMEVLLRLPPLPEQKKIAAILSSVDEAIQATQAVIDQTRRVKEGLLQDLLTRGIGHTRFKQTEIGEIPEGWTLKRLEDVSDFITKGSTPTTFGFSWVDDGIPFLRSECVGEEGFTSSGLMHIPVEAQRAMARSTVRSGDILVTITGNVGRVARYPVSMPEGNINQHIARVRILPEAQLTEDFVFYSLSARRQRAEFERIVTGQAYPQLSLAQVRDTLVPCPGVAEQRAISRKLRAVDATMAAHVGSRHALILTKSGLLTDLLTGKVRVTP